MLKIGGPFPLLFLPHVIIPIYSSLSAGMAFTPSESPPGSSQSDDIGYQLVAVGACFLVLVLVLLALRIVAQLLTRRKPGMDDYFLYLGILCVIAVDGISICTCFVLPSQQCDMVICPASFSYHSILSYDLG